MTRRLYHIPDYERNWERVLRSLAAYKEENCTFTARELAERSGLQKSGSLIRYYLKQAITRGIAAHESQQKYRAI